MLLFWVVTPGGLASGYHLFRETISIFGSASQPRRTTWIHGYLYRRVNLKSHISRLLLILINGNYTHYHRATEICIQHKSNSYLATYTVRQHVQTASSPSSLLTNGCWRFLPRAFYARGVKLFTQFHLLSRLRQRETILLPYVVMA
jgi:hypothetical protein